MSELTEATQKAQTGKPTARDLVQRQAPEIGRQLAGVMNTDAFVRSAISTISNSPQLQQATPNSILGSIMLAAQLKLEIGPALQHFYLTPRKVNGQWTCLPIIGYQGYIELAYRNPKVEKVESFLVREGDLFNHGADNERGRFFEWVPKDYDEDRPWTGAVAMAKMRGAGTVWAYLTKSQVMRRKPANSDKGPWASHEEEMARKTAIRALSPYMPKSIEQGQALRADEHVVEHIDDSSDLIIHDDDA